MDFISSLIKRPISLVLTETSTTMDKYPISASLPNTPSKFENYKKDVATPTNEEQNESKRPLSMSSSYNGDNLTDFIGVPEDFLDEFRDILPPPSLPLHNSNHLIQSILDIDETGSLSITQSYPPLAFQLHKEKSPSPSIKTSPTIDELLLQINDNLQQAGLNDDDFAIVAPSNKSELSPLPSKAALNNSKQLNATKSSTTAAGSASMTVFEMNSSVHKFHIDPELENVIICDNPKQEQQEYEQDQHAAQDQVLNSGVNISSKKFLGLTEFDEAKIPELPGDLEPNIEEQYNVTFEKCFIPTLNVQKGATIVPDEFKINRPHFLSSTETDIVSSDNETFADCNDDKDPLTTTLGEPPSLDVTTDFESYQSANNKSLSITNNNTMDNIADITMEAECQPLQKITQAQVIQQSESNLRESELEPMEVDEPMDIDMNETLENIHNTSSNIKHVEQVLQHDENILQHLEDKNSLDVIRSENLVGLLEKQTEPPSTIVSTESERLDIEHCSCELSLQKTIELPAITTNSLNAECIIENPNKDVAQEENNDLDQAKDKSANSLSSTSEGLNCSPISSTSVKSTVDNKLNITLNLSAASMDSKKSSPPSSPSFPTKTVQSAGFPRSPKAVAEKPVKSPFLEKSDYNKNQEHQPVEERTLKNLNELLMESPKSGENNNVKDKFKESMPAVDENNERITVIVDTELGQSLEEEVAIDKDFENNRQTLSIDKLEKKSAADKRRTFSVELTENGSTTLAQCPSVEKIESRRTFAVTDTENMPSDTLLATAESDLKSRRTFNLPSEEFTQNSADQNDINKSSERMEVIDTMSHSTTMSLSRDAEQITESLSLSSVQQTSESSELPCIRQNSQSPPLPSITSQSSLPPTIQPSTQSPSLPAMHPRSQSPAVATMQSTTQSPPTMQPKSQSPPLPSMQPISHSPPLPTMLPIPQSPPLPALQPRTQSPPSRPIRNQIQSEEIEATPQSPTESTTQQAVNIKKEQISPPSFETTSTSFSSQPLSTLIQKRPPIRDARARTADILSAKEQSNIKVKDEKDIFVEKFATSPIEDIFTSVSATSTTLSNSSAFSQFEQTSSTSRSSVAINTAEPQTNSQQFEDEFSGSNNIILNPSDFDYLLTKGNNYTPVDRSSLLLKFDPLLGVPVPVNQQRQQELPISTSTNNPYLSPPLEEDEHNYSNSSFVLDTKLAASAKLLEGRSQEVKQKLKLEQQVQRNKRQLTQETKEKNATMSVDVIKDMSLNNDCNKTFENSNSTQSDDKQINYKMDELEKKIKNEVLKTEDIEKKLKDAEQREETLIKRITEKDKTIAKMNGVIEAYEKAIAELIADKEQLIQQYEKQLAEVKADRDSNYHHLTSLETTFSDLHVKYEKSKEMTCQLKESEEALQAEKRRSLENLHLQEQRYDKMKNHAMQQLEIANKKLESLTREHSIEITKLKVLLKKEEIARSSINEQLAHKTKENAELVKICDELISGQGSHFSFEPADSKKH